MAINLMSYQKSINEDYVHEIAESMMANGWQGVEMVIWGDCIITGNHRYAATEIADIDPETITLEEVFAEAGIDFDDAHADAGFPAADDDLSYLFNLLPAEIINKYDIQW